MYLLAMGELLLLSLPTRESPLNQSTEEEEEKKRGLAFSLRKYLHIFFLFLLTSSQNWYNSREKNSTAEKKNLRDYYLFGFFENCQREVKTEINKKEKCFLGWCSIKEGKKQIRRTHASGKWCSVVSFHRPHKRGRKRKNLKLPSGHSVQHLFILLFFFI